MFPVLQLGRLAIQTPGLILLLGLWLGLELAERHATQAGLIPNKIFNFALAGIAGGLLGGRLLYAAANPQVFYDNPLNLFSLSSQLISPAGGVIFATAAGVAYAWQVGMPIWSTLDCIVSLLAVWMVSLGLANFASGDAYGLPANLPWAIYLWGATRHPAQLYETAAALFGTILTWPGAFAAWMRSWNQPGMRWWVFLAFSSASRLFLEAFRASGSLFGGQFRLAQLLAWLILAFSLWQIARRSASATRPAEA
jgi:phosphatidylglycerol---prolipoprotein diacylglyceryl transferase